MKRTITQIERDVLEGLLSRAALHGRRQSEVRADVQRLLGATSIETPLVVWPFTKDQEAADTDRLLAIYGITVEGTR